MNNAIDSLNKNFAFMSEIQNSISKITPNIAPILSNTDVLFRNQEIVDSATRFMRMISNNVEFQLPPQTMAAVTEALQAMCDYVSPQNRNVDKLSMPETPAKHKQNFFDKLEAVAEKYKCSLPLLISLIALLSSTVFGVLSLQSQNSDTSEELQLRQIEVDRAQVEQTEELSKAIKIDFAI